MSFVLKLLVNKLSDLKWSLCCSSQTITRLLIGYTPIQNGFGVKKKIKLKKNDLKCFHHQLGKKGVNSISVEGCSFSTVTIMILFGLVGAYVPVFKVRGCSRIWFSYGPAKG